MPWLSQATYVALGRCLAGIRHEAGLTQDELAARLRKPQSFVSAYERGQRRVDLLEFLAILDALAKDPAEALGAVLKAVRHPSTRAVRTAPRR